MQKRINKITKVLLILACVLLFISAMAFQMFALDTTGTSAGQLSPVITNQPDYNPDTGISVGGLNWDKRFYSGYDRAYTVGVTGNPDHILLEDDFVRFYGYGVWAKLDYLFYNNASDDENTYTFTLNQNNADYHSMLSVGFMTNFVVNADGTYSGFLVSMEQKNITIRKVVNVNLPELAAANNGGQELIKSKSTIIYTDPTPTGVGTGNTMHNIVLRSGSTFFEIERNGAPLYSWNLAEAEGTAAMPDTYTGGGGFGIYSAYASHNCNKLSWASFTDFKLTVKIQSNIQVNFIDMDAVATTAEHLADPQVGSGLVGQGYTINPPKYIEEYEFVKADNELDSVYEDGGTKQINLYYQRPAVVPDSLGYYVEYYKGSVAKENQLATESLSAPAGSSVRVDVNKHLPATGYKLGTIEGSTLIEKEGQIITVVYPIDDGTGTGGESGSGTGAGSESGNGGGAESGSCTGASSGSGGGGTESGSGGGSQSGSGDSSESGTTGGRPESGSGDESGSGGGGESGSGSGDDSSTGGGDSSSSDTTQSSSNNGGGNGGNGGGTGGETGGGDNGGGVVVVPPQSSTSKPYTGSKAASSSKGASSISASTPLTVASSSASSRDTSSQSSSSSGGGGGGGVVDLATPNIPGTGLNTGLTNGGISGTFGGAISNTAFVAIGVLIAAGMIVGIFLNDGPEMDNEEESSGGSAAVPEPVFRLLSANKEYIGYEHNRYDYETGTMEALEVPKAPQEINLRIGWRILAVLAACAASVTLVLTGGLQAPLALFDQWTPLMMLYLLIEVVAGIMASRGKPELYEEEDANEDIQPLRQGGWS
ncbi:MAG: MucBP domain-containing protein [Oscillospiraceae bacterium]